MKNQRGFTLMETLLAAALFAIIMTSGFSVFQMGLQIWKRTQGSSKMERKVLLTFEKMGRGLRSAMRVPLPQEILGKQEIEYGGNHAGFSFPAMVTKASKQGELITQTGKISYRFESSSQTLCRINENASDFYLKKNVPCEALVQGVQSVKFQYWLYDKIGKEYDWYEEWDTKRGMPQAVRISLTVPAVQNSPKKEYHQTWLIPAGGERS